MTLNMAIAKRINVLMDVEGISIPTLAEKTNLSVSKLKTILNGECKLNTSILFQIIISLKTTYADFFNDEIFNEIKNC